MSARRHAPTTPPPPPDASPERRPRDAAEAPFLLDLVSDGVVLVGPDRRVRRFNQAARELLGWTTDEVVGERIEVLLGGDPTSEGAPGEPMPVALLERVEATGEAWRGELPLRRRDGELVRTLVTLTRLAPEGGRPQGVALVCRDVRAQRRAAEALRETEDQLQRAQRLEALGRLAAGMAHDFNNVLAVIYGSSQFLAQGIQEDDARRDDIRAIQEAVKSASTLTQQLLAFGRGQSLALEPLDLDATVAETERMLRRVIGDDVRLRTDLRSGGAQVKADRGRLQQVLVNLAVNARDAMHEGGTLVIETSVGENEAGPPGEGPVPERHLLLRVTDDGIGMDEETRARLFEPFFTTKSEGQGTGLGLAVVYGIVTQLGGDIAVDSTFGVGTSFEIRLPLLAEGGTRRQPTLPPPAAAPGTATSSLLVVEDDHRVRASMVRLLRHQGFGVVEAADAHEALALVEADPGCVDVVLTDVVMPQMSGPAMVEALRRARPTLPVVYVSGYVDEGSATSAGRDRGAPVLSKPFTVDQLLEAIRAASRDAAV